MTKINTGCKEQIGICSDWNIFPKTCWYLPLLWHSSPQLCVSIWHEHVYPIC